MQSLRRKGTHTILRQVTTLRESETTQTQITQLEKSIFFKELAMSRNIESFAKLIFSFLLFCEFFEAF